MKNLMKRSGAEQRDLSYQRQIRNKKRKKLWGKTGIKKGSKKKDAITKKGKGCTKCQQKMGGGSPKYRVFSAKGSLKEVILGGFRILKRRGARQRWKMGGGIPG